MSAGEMSSGEMSSGETSSGETSSGERSSVEGRPEIGPGGRWARGPADGPVAVGGSVTASVLLDAYRQGLFPFPTDDPEEARANERLYAPDVAEGRMAVLEGAGAGDPYAITWWHPDPRLLIPRGTVHLGRSLRRRLRQSGWTTTCNAAFSDVVRACAEGRTPAWLTEEYRTALDELHEAGWAHSIEVWEEGELVGGLFGLAFGSTFSADSAFRRRSGAAQAAIADLDARLARSGVAQIDVQWDSAYLHDLGAVTVPRETFLGRLPRELTPVRPATGTRGCADLAASSAAPAAPSRAPERPADRGDHDELGEPADSDVVDLILRQGAERPQEPALVGAEGTLDYGTLCRRARAVAGELRAEGVADGDIVLVQGGRDCATVVALLGALLAGAGYAAVEPTVPPARLRRLGELASPRLVLTVHQDQFATSDVPVRSLAQVTTAAAPAGPVPGTAPVRGQDAPAYVVLTSGTTGLPKAVVVGRPSLSWHNRAVRETFGLTPGDRVLQAASLAFDVSAEEIWPALAAGASVHFLPHALGETGYAAFSDFVETARITVCNLPSSYFAGWEGHVAQTGRGTGELRLVVAGSEVLPVEAARRWSADPTRPPLLNAYGTSEATITSLVGRVRTEETAEDRVSLGTPLPGVRVRIVDGLDRDVADGEPGQLLLGGPGVTGAWHRTGDLVHRGDDGRFWFHGRLDDQLKIQGVRAESAEIEAALMSVSEADDARVVAVEGRLVAFLRSSQNVDVARVSQRLEALLPAPLVPGEILVREAFPVTPGGKVDVPALRELAGAVPTEQPGAGADIDAVLRRLWSTLLPDAQVVTDESDFFALGGTSLIATRMIGALRRETGLVCPMRTVFRYPVLGELSAHLRGQGQERPA